MNDQFIRRLTAAAAELGLAIACFNAARAALDNAEPDFFITGLICIEFLSLSALRTIIGFSNVGKEDQPAWRVVLGLGASGIMAFFTLLSVSMMFMFFMILLFIEPLTFVLLMIAGGRRILWRRAWHAQSADPEELNQQISRTYKAHWLAMIVAALCSVLMKLFFVPDFTGTEELQNALMLAGASGYFVSLGIYLMAGKIPVVEEEPAKPITPLERPGSGSIIAATLSNWTQFLPGILLLFVVIEVMAGSLEADLRAFVMPLLIGAGGWLLVAGAGRVLGTSADTSLCYGLPRATTFFTAFVSMFIGTLVLLFFSLPLISEITGQELDPDNFSPEMQAGMAVALIAIGYLFIRLWPIATLPFFAPHDKIKGMLYSQTTTAWYLTSGLSGFLYGALPPVVIFALTLSLPLLPDNLGFVGALISYLFVAPLTAVYAMERTRHMVEKRQPDDFFIHYDQTAAPEGEGSIPIPVPVPVPLPVPSGTTDPRNSPPTSQTSHKRETVNDSHRETLLIEAVMQENLLAIDDLIRKGVSPDLIHDTESLLLLAIRLNKPGSVSLLLDHGADVFTLGISGSSVVHYAAINPAMHDFISVFVDQGISVNELNNHGESPVMSALHADCLAGFGLLKDLGADLHHVDDRGNNLLYHFARGNYGLHRERRQRDYQGENFEASEITYLAPIRELVSAGVDPLLVGQYGEHAASVAGAGGLTELLVVFHEGGADLSKPDQASETAMRAAAAAGHRDTVARLRSFDLTVDFMTAVCSGFTDQVKQNLDEDPTQVSSHTSDRFPRDALTMAVFHGHAEIVRLLLDAGADINTRKTMQGSILHLAVRHLPDMVSELIRRGADLEAIDGDMNTPLNFAARENNLKVAKLLLEAGANPDARTERGYPPSYFATSEEMIELLNSYL